MVYCGKPSKGCEYCRKRKIKCDQKIPGCSQCSRSKLLCPGYRDPMTLMFRNESDSVARKAREKKESKGRRDVQCRTSVGRVTSTDESSTTQFLESDASLSTARLVTSIIPRNPMLTVRDLATCFFWQNFVRLDSDCAKFTMKDFPTMMHESEHLSAAISSVGMACFANIAHSPEAMIAARQEYASAVRLTKAALQDPMQAKTDAMVRTVILLADFEAITCRLPQSMQAWTNHIQGAYALLRLRGREQLQNQRSLNIFYLLRGQILISAIQREAYVPSPVLEWSNYVQDVYSADSLNLFNSIVIEFANVRAAMQDRSLHDPLEIIPLLQRIDADLTKWAANLPEAWSCITKVAPADLDTYEDFYHLYPDLWTTTMWNSYRAVRLLINEHILLQIENLDSSSPNSNRSIATSLLQEQAHILMAQLCSDVCASTPYYLGVGSTSGSTEPPPRPLAGFQLMWPLFVCGTLKWCPTSLRKWVSGQLRIIGHYSGIQQALPLAELMEKKGDLLEWCSGKDEGDLIASRGSESCAMPCLNAVSNTSNDSRTLTPTYSKVTQG